MQHLETFSTARVPTRQRLSYWNRVVKHTLTSALPRLSPDDNFAAEMTCTHLDEIVFFELACAGARVRYPASNRPLMPARFIVQVITEGSSVSRHYGREAKLQTGDFVLIDGRPSAPFEAETVALTRKLHMAIPCELLRRYIACPEDIAGVRMPSDNPVNSLVATTIVEFWKRWTTASVNVNSRRFSHALLEMIAAAYENLPKAEWSSRTSAAHHRAQIISYIESRLQEPALSPASIASAMRMTVRNLHYVFATGEETVGQYIQRRRLEEGARALRSVVLQGRTLSDIAYDCGFNGATQFGRAFRRHFGVTPSEYRQSQLQAL